MLEVAVKLFSVTIVMAGGLLLAARYGRGGGRPGSGVRVSGRHGVSKGAVVAIVEVDGRRFLVGAGDQQVTLLTELEPTPEVEPAHDEGAVPADTASSLPTRLGVALAQAHRHARRPHRTGPTTTHGPRIGPLDRLRAMTVRTPVGAEGATPGSEPPIHVQPPPTP